MTDGVRVMNVTTTHPVATVAVSQNRMVLAGGCAAFDSNRACTQGFADLYYADTGALLRTFTEPRGQVWFVTTSPDGKRLLGGGTDRKIYVWDLRHFRLERAFEGHNGGVTGLAFAPDGRHFASSSQDGTVRFWGLPPLGP